MASVNREAGEPKLKGISKEYLAEQYENLAILKQSLANEWQIQVNLEQSKQR